MVRSTSMMERRPGKRPTVAVVYQDPTTGYQCADWFALHGYQATLTAAAHQLERNLQELHPDVIVIGFTTAPMPLHATVPRLRTTCPQVPIIAMMNRSAEGGNGADLEGIEQFGADVFRCDSLDPPSSLS